MKKTEVLEHIDKMKEAIDMLPNNANIEIHITMTKDFIECTVYDMSSLNKVRISK